MDDRERKLRDAVRRAWPTGGQPPPFESIWEQAQQRQRRTVPGRALGAAAVAAIAVFAIVYYGVTPQPQPYIETADLMDTTYWVAPSDALLPERSFDIYQDLPELFESTEPAEGALL